MWNMVGQYSNVSGVAVNLKTGDIGEERNNSLFSVLGAFMSKSLHLEFEKDGIEVSLNIPKALLDQLPKSSFAFNCPKCKASNSEGEALIFIGYLNSGTGFHPDFGTTYYWDDLIVCHKCKTVYTVHDGNP